MHIQLYLFNGRCEEAFAFYQRALGAEVTALMRFKESPEPEPPGMLPARLRKQSDARGATHW